MKDWEFIADRLSKAGWSWGCVSAIDSNGRTIWIVDAHRDNGKRFIVHADDKLTAFAQMERAIHEDENSAELFGISHSFVSAKSTTSARARINCC
ncbi:MAG: hypothetical protein WA849_16125 [Candidatus Udaeobacter sp.]